MRDLVLGILEDLVCNRSGPLGIRLRRAYWSRRLKFCGKRVVFGVGVRIYQPEWISIGDDTWIDDYVTLVAGPVEGKGRDLQIKENPSFPGQIGELIIGERVHVVNYAFLNGHGGIYVGNDCGIGAGCKVYSASHRHRNASHPDSRERPYCPTSMAPPDMQSIFASPVVLEDGVAICLNALVLPGTTVRRGTWIGIGVTARGEYEGGMMYALPQEPVPQPRWP